MSLHLRRPLALLLAATLALVVAGCDDDDDGTEADRLGVGAQCVDNQDCLEDEGQACLGQFKGGYCGIAQCMSDADCPEASKCVAHEDQVNYCFRVCLDKADCNRNRSADNEANCSSNITFLDEESGVKACVPPSN